MSTPVELLHQRRYEELWQMCCGFADLNLEQVMGVQKRLLLEQIEKLKRCELGRKIMRGSMPATVEQFVAEVPLTTYADYCPELLEKKEDVLPEKPLRWVRTSGRSGEYDTKWVPMSQSFCDELLKVGGGVVIFAFADGKGDVSQVREHLKVLYTMGPPTYGSGAVSDFMRQAINFDLLPSRDSDEPFEERIRAGFKEAMDKGLDAFGGLPFILVAVGEQFKRQSQDVDYGFILSHPRALARMLEGVLKSKLARRPMMPRDVWRIKAIVGGGTDTVVFKKKVEELWGRYPLEVYAGTEGGLYATQLWDYGGMIFIPTLNFFEFIPEDEHFKWQLDHSYRPKTVLLDGVQAGQKYEVVVTNLHGGALVRFRLGDMVRITSLRDEQRGIDIPQMVFDRRADDLIDLGPIRLTERILWQAIENTGIPYADWTARKEMAGNRAMLHLFLELKDNYLASEKGVATAVYEQIKKLDDGFIHQDLATMERYLEFRPVGVTLLPQGAFDNYKAQRQAQGADLAHLKPPHINPSEAMLSLLGARVPAVAPEVKVEAEAQAGSSLSQS